MPALHNVLSKIGLGVFVHVCLCMCVCVLSSQTEGYVLCLF